MIVVTEMHQVDGYPYDKQLKKPESAEAGRSSANILPNSVTRRQTAQGRHYSPSAGSIVFYLPRASSLIDGYR
jgi:hypothetical protein